MRAREHLLGEYNDAKAERRRGARIRRGTVSPYVPRPRKGGRRG